MAQPKNTSGQQQKLLLLLQSPTELKLVMILHTQATPSQDESVHQGEYTLGGSIFFSWKSLCNTKDFTTENPS